MGRMDLNSFLFNVYLQFVNCELYFILYERNAFMM